MVGKDNYGKGSSMRLGYTLKRLQDFAWAVTKLKQLTRHDRWTRQKLLHFQQRQLSSLVKYAIQHSPFYREFYGNKEIDDQIALNTLPIIDKATMMENFDRVVTDPRLKLTSLQAHLGRLTRDEYYLGHYRVLTTGGSSSQKGIFVFNRNEWSTILGGTFRAAATMGMSTRLPNRWKITWIVADSAIHVSNRMSASSDIGHVKMQRLYATAGIDHLVDALNSFQPEALFTYPSIASLLAIEQLEGRLHIRPQVVETSSEVRTNDMELNIRKAWGVFPHNLYGTTECGAFNVDCSFHRGIHIFEDLWIAEVVDEKYQPVPDGSPGHKVLMTNLYNFTQPLIRYEVTDMLTMSAEPCPCGRPFRLISTVDGRSDDIMYLPGCGGQHVPVHPFHFYTVMRALLDAVKEYQFVHEDNGINISVVLRAGACEEGLAGKLAGNLRAHIESLGATCPDIHVRFADKIERDPRTMGKMKLVKSNARVERIMGSGVV
jgi:phenylacetate-CoA ligase